MQRNIFHQALLAALVLVGVIGIGVGAHSTPSTERQSKVDTSAPLTPASSPDRDLIVIGGGAAGLAAALEGAASGLRVTIVDMNTQLGGHAITSSGLMAFPGTDLQEAHGVSDSKGLLISDVRAYGGDPDEQWLETYAELAVPEVYQWLRTMGVRFDGIDVGPGNSVDRLHAPVGRGFGAFGPLIAAVLREPTIEKELRQEAVDLVTDRGRIVGVTLRDTRTRAERTIFARAVLVATGGFQSNLEKVRATFGYSIRGAAHIDDDTRLLEGSGWFSRGSGLALVDRVGGWIDHLERQWNYGQGAVDPRFPDSERGLNVFIRGIWVNREGERFMNEDSSMRDIFGGALEAPGQIYWDVFDARHRSRIFVSGTHWNASTIERDFLGSPQVVKSAESLGSLAEKIGVPGDTLERTVLRYNAMVKAGEDLEFGRFTGGKRALDTILLRRGDERPLSIDGPTYYAVALHPLPRKSMGGVVVDGSTRVLDTKGVPIPGLYAAGEVTGFGGINGLYSIEGLFLSPSMLMGRIAAATVAHPGATELQLAPLRAFERHARAIPAPAASTSRDGDAKCVACHSMQPEDYMGDGWLHFRLAHHTARQDGLGCASCHGRLSPYPRSEDATAHRMETEDWLSTCSRCHLAPATQP